MIMPTIRASFSRGEAQHLVWLLGRNDPEMGKAAQRRLDEDGIDSILDDPRVLNALMTDAHAGASPAVLAYVLVRQALLECGIDDRGMADYVATLLVRFGCGSRAYRVSDKAEEEFHYLVDIATRSDGESGKSAFLLRCHLGNYSLWISGLFPDWLERRVDRKGAPRIAYYERMGATGYRLAADTREAEALGVGDVFRRVAREFPGVRTALNRMSDRYLFPGSANVVNRLLRDVAFRYPIGPPGSQGSR
jgi:hypothetical protein